MKFEQIETAEHAIRFLQSKTWGPNRLIIKEIKHRGKFVKLKDAPLELLYKACICVAGRGKGKKDYVDLVLG